MEQKKSVTEIFDVLVARINEHLQIKAKTISDLSKAKKFEEIKKEVDSAGALESISEKILCLKTEWSNLQIDDHNDDGPEKENIDINQRTNVKRERNSFVITIERRNGKSSYTLRIMYEDFYKVVEELLHRLDYSETPCVKTSDIMNDEEGRDRTKVDRTFRILMFYQFITRLKENRTLYKWFNDESKAKLAEWLAQEKTKKTNSRLKDLFTSQ